MRWMRAGLLPGICSCCATAAMVSRSRAPNSTQFAFDACA
jgi:hypothetical protein